MQAPTGPGQLLELFISARYLKSLDLMSESDPYCRVLFKDSFMQSFSLLGRTETTKNQSNPNWATTFTFMYLFEVEQTLTFEVIDDDGSDGDFIGRVSTPVGAILGSRGTLILEIKKDAHSASTGKLIIRAEPVNASRDTVRLEVHGQHLDDKDFFSKSDPFLVINRIREDGSLLPVHKTEVIDNNLNPMWRPFEMKAQSLCNSDPNMPIIMEAWDDESSGKHQFIGRGETTLTKLKAKEAVTLINPEKASKRGYQNSGVLLVRTCEIHTEYDFIDYLKGGVQLSLMVAIDFTGSNGSPSAPSSLHFLSPNSMNSYERAIWAVGNILEPYDSSKTYPVWGFGGKPPGSNSVSHCFSLANGEVVGVEGILRAYRTCLQGVELSGPTLFEHVITAASNITREYPPGSNYTVLLILTDGAIHDMAVTKSLIVDASVMPLSIIIVGVGNADFGMMEELDCDSGMLRDQTGRTAIRDIVQFVPFRKYEGDGRRLAQEVLAEVPKQLIQFMKHHRVVPRPPETVAMANIQVAPSAPPA